jgi:Flp pilus assembly protein protease CpaA
MTTILLAVFIGASIIHALMKLSSPNMMVTHGMRAAQEADKGRYGYAIQLGLLTFLASMMTLAIPFLLVWFFG